VWALTAVLVTVSFGQAQSSFPGYATRPGGISPHALAVAYAVNTTVVVAAQLPVLRWMAGRRRTTGAALAAACWTVSWMAVLAAGHLGGAAAQVGFAAATAIFAVGECLLSPTLPAIINDLAPPEAAGRYNGFGVLAFTTGFLLGPVGGGVALGAGWSTGLFVALAAACAAAGLAAYRLAGRLPAAANQVPPAQPNDDSARLRHQDDPQPYAMQSSSP
jgi:MFS family permease